MKNKSYSSFTLTEAVIWAGIISIITAFSITSTLSFYWKWSFEQQALILLNDIDTARELSLYKRETVRICFFGDKNYYRIILDQDNPSNKKYLERKLRHKTGFPLHYGISPFYYYDEQGIVRTGSINFGTSSSDSYGELRFNFEGVPSSGGHVALYSASMNKAMVLIVKPVTGRARIGKVKAIFKKP